MWYKIVNLESWYNIMFYIYQDLILFLHQFHEIFSSNIQKKYYI